MPELDDERIARIKGLSHVAAEATKLYSSLPEKGRLHFVDNLAYLVAVQDIRFGNDFLKYPLGSPRLRRLDQIILEDQKKGLVTMTVDELTTYGVAKRFVVHNTVGRSFTNGCKLLYFNLNDMKALRRHESRHNAAVTRYSQGSEFHSLPVQPPNTRVTGLIMGGNRPRLRPS